MCCTQVAGCVERVYIEKKRNARGTCCEFFSHFILLLLLVFGYGLSTVFDFEQATYNDIVVEVPVLNTSTINLMEILQGPLIIPNLDQYVQLGSLFEQQLAGARSALSATQFGDSLENMMYNRELHYAPRGATLDSLIQHLNQTYPSSFAEFTHMIHDSEDRAVDYILDNALEPFALIVLRDISPEKVNYVIRQKYTTLPDTNEISIAPSIGLDTNYLNYFFSGFLTMKKSIDRWAFNYTGAVNSTASARCALGAPEITLTPFPTFEYSQNPFYTSVGFLLGLAMIMSTMYPMSKLAKSVVEEKELRMRELMKIMGLSDWAHQFSWFLSSFVLFFWIALTATLITTTSFIQASSRFLIFMYFFLFTMSEINLSFLVSVFFSNSKLAAIAAPVVIFATILPRYIFYTVSDNEQVGNKILACFLSPTAFAFGADFISTYEYAGMGIQPYNLFDGQFNFGICLVMMFVDFLLYGFLAWYLDQVIPQEHGTPKHPLFIFSTRYWCTCLYPQKLAGQALDFDDMEEFRQRRQQTRTPGTEAARGAAAVEEEEGGGGAGDNAPVTYNDRIEQLPLEMLPQGKVRIKHLGKTYPDGKVAVREFSLTMLEGQITCLLGHNGAGKSTTISALTGMTEATTGDVSIYGFFLSKELQAIRQLTGLCPQHNVLYPNLTVLEHLRFFGLLKGIRGAALKRRIEYMIQEVGLTEKRDTRSKALSGGMKRKLCLAMALIGDPKFVLLDEPTSGMDPYSRRATWELLQKHKAGRVILLTTHFMDEADTLADRIAIMSEGVLLCSGSSLFLKNRFGAGYLLSCSKTASDVPVDNIEAEVQAVVPAAKILSSVAGEVILRLPLGAAPSFPELFGMLQKRKSALGIKSFGISITSLEQVFISLSHAYDPNRFEPTRTLLNRWKEWLWGDTKVFPCSGTSQVRQNRSFSQSLPDSNLPPAIGASDSRSEEGKMTELVDVSSPSVVRAYQRLSSTPLESSSSQITLSHPSAPAGTLGSSDNVHSMGMESHWKEDQAAMKHIEDSGIGKVHFINQTVELYRKRLIIASRDWKGFFFQIVFPAIQILLIMLILNIEINPAGKTIILNGNVFKRYGFIEEPLGVVANANANNYEERLEGGFGRQDMGVTTWRGRWNSSDVSEFLLDKTRFLDSRFGAVVFADTVPFYIRVDWEWVREQLSSVPNLGNATNDFLMDTFGEDYSFTIDSQSPWMQGLLPVSGVNATSWLQTNNINVTQGVVLLRNTFNLTALIMSLPNNTRNAVTSFPLLANMTAPAFTNLLNNITNTALTNLILQVPGNWTNTTSYITLDSSGIELVIETNLAFMPNISQTIPWDSLTYDDIEPFLPDGMVSYNFSIPSPYTVMHNSTSPHALAAWHGELTEAAFQTCQANENAAYYTKNHPLPISTEQSLSIRIILSLLTSVFILVPLCYIPAAFVSFLVRERVSKSKHLQLASGVSPYLYWAAAYLWDMSLFAILTGFILIAFYIVGKSSSSVFVGDVASNLAVLCLVMAYGASAIPLNYMYSFFFSNHSTAQISITLVNFMTGFVLVMAYYIMANIQETQAAAEVLVHIFRFFPAYNIGEGFINMSTNYYETAILGGSRGPFHWYVCGRNLVFMFAEAVGFSLMVLLSESRMLRNGLGVVEAQLAKRYGPPPPPRSGVDSDVSDEERLVEKLVALLQTQPGAAEARVVTQSGVPGTDHSSSAPVEPFVLEEDVEAEPTRPLAKTLSSLALLIHGLVKTYVPLELMGKPKYAVRGLSLACQEGERFGLLGINGAGKTTTLGILTGEINLTEGSVYIGNKPLSDGLTQRMLGYCPQVDPLLELMTGYETLRFFGRIRGLDEALLERRVQALVRQTGLLPHAHRPCGTYSGGNKRKLSLAVALIGDPKVLLLDEPSTGMDPEARRHMWNVIEQVSAQRTVVLVSHSMEEIEALCTRVGVMVSGRMQCLGSVQHLKSKFGGAYTVEVRCAVDQLQACLRLCQEALADSVLEEKHGGFFRLRIDRDINLARIFALLEDNKQALHIYDYSVSQCSLEQVFIKFAKEQEEERGESSPTSAAHAE